MNGARFARLGLAAGVAAPATVLVAFAIGIAQHPELNHMTDTVSKLSAQGLDHPWAMSTGFALYGIMMIGFARGLRLVTDQRFDPGRMALATHGALMICAAVFRDDLTPWGWTTFVGALHDITGGMAFTALFVAMVLLAMASRHRTAGLIYAAVFLITGLGFLATPLAYAGVSERIFSAVAIVWVQAVTIMALRTAKRSRHSIQ